MLLFFESIRHYIYIYLYIYTSLILFSLEHVSYDNIIYVLVLVHVYAYGPRTVLVKRTFWKCPVGGNVGVGRWGGAVGWGGGVGWGGVGMLTFFVVRTLGVATLQRSLVSLLRYMLLRCRDLWFPCYCYAAEISGFLTTLHVATLQRSLVSLLRYLCCYAAQISGILATSHVATLQRSLVALLRYMLLRCRDL